MKNFRFVIVAAGAATVILTVVLGLLVGAVWAVIAAASGIIVVVSAIGYVQMKTLQTVTQRLAGIQKQNERLTNTLQSVHTIVSKYPAGGSIKLPREVLRAFEDLTLASRSLTVPQVHFDQLLRTISANTVRTEAALSDVVADVREIVERERNVDVELTETGHR